MPYTDLITITDVTEANTLGAMIDRLSSDADVQREVERIITHVTEWMEADLGRRFIVQETRQGIARHEWSRDEYQDTTTVETQYVTWADEQPVVQVTAPTGVSTSFDGRKLVRDEATPGVTIYFAGYKRADQTLVDLQSEFPDLTETPDVLPALVKDTAIELVTILTKEMQQGRLGERSVERDVGTQTVRVDGLDTAQVDRIMSRLRAGYNRFQMLA